MKKNRFLYSLFYYKVTIIVLLIVTFLSLFFVTQFIINPTFAKYEITLTSKSDNKIDNDFLVSQVDKIINYNKEAKVHNNKLDNKEIEGEYMNTIYTPSGTDMYKVASNANIKYENNYLILSLNQNEFLTTFVTKTMKVSEGITKCDKFVASLFDSKVDGIEIIDIDIYEKSISVNYQNPYILGAIGSGLIFVFILIVLFIYTRGHDIKVDNDIYDNEIIYRYPFKKSYWKSSKDAFKSIKNLSVMSILFALMMICKAISLPSGFGALGISLTYLFFSIIALIYGPIAGLTIGFFSDILGFILFPDGQMFFLGYTIDAMLAGFVYGIFFYKTKLSFSKCLYARIIVNLFINTILGSMWWSIINNFSFDVYVTYTLIISLPKNLLYLLPQSILLYIVIKVVLKPICAYGLVDLKIKENISLLWYKCIVIYYKKIYNLIVIKMVRETSSMTTKQPFR